MKLRGSQGLVLVLVLAGCDKNAKDEPTTPPVTTGQGVALEDARVELSGKVLAHDGTALRRAELMVRRNGFFEPVGSAVIGDDGAFRISIPTGVYSISIAAVDHRMVLRNTVVTGDLQVEGRMGTYARSDPEDTLRIRSEYLDAEGKVLGPGPSQADRGSGGAHRLELKDKPAGASRLRYQISSPSGRTYNGPLADDYENDGGGDFWSIVDVSTKDALELDMSKLPPAGVSPQLRWSGESEATATVIDFQDRCFEDLEGIRNRMPRKDGKIMEMTDELRAEAEALSAKTRAEVDAVTDPTTHALLRAVHLSCFGTMLYGPESQPATREEVAWLLERVSPTDLHLDLILNFDTMQFQSRHEADQAFLAKSDAWLERRAKEHTEPNAAIDALNALIHFADAGDDQARVEELYRLAMDDRFEGTFQQQYIKSQFDPNRVLKRGNQFPAFDLAGLHDTDPRVTSADRAGKLYLVEFWATWCGPCVAEMPKLHATYAAINGAKPGKGKGKAKGKAGDKKGKASGKGEGDDEGLRALQPVKDPKIEFVFVSLDAAPGDVEAFRKASWSMPWTHAFVGNSGEKDAMERFGFFGVPTMILVDEKGTILEYGNAMRGESLQPLLERVLAERKASP